MESPEPITLTSILVGALIAGGAATVAKGIYDSVVTGNWDPEYIFKRDTANLIDSIIPGAQAGGLGNFVREGFGLPKQELDGAGLGLAIASSVLQVVGSLGQLAGAAKGVSTAAKIGESGNAIATPGAQLGSEIANQTFKSVDAFNQFHNPLGLGLADALDAGLVDSATGAIKTYGMDAIGTPAGAAGAAQGVKTVAEQGGVAPQTALNIGTKQTAAGVQNIANEMNFGDVKVPPATPVQQFGHTISKGLGKALRAPREVYKAPFEALGEATNPMLGNVAQKTVGNVGTNVLQESTRKDPDYGRAILGGLAGTAAGYTAATALGPSSALADELKARNNAHPATIDPLQHVTGTGLDRLNRGASAGADTIARAGVSAAMTPPEPVRRTPPVVDPYRLLYPQRYINRFNPRVLG